MTVCTLCTHFGTASPAAYRQLVLEHLHVSEPLAAGIHALAVPGLAGGFAAVVFD